jgi:hypothetical protein
MKEKENNTFFGKKVESPAAVSKRCTFVHLYYLTKAYRENTKIGPRSPH